MIPLQWFLLFHLASPVLMWVMFYVLYNRLAGDTTRWQILWVVGVVLDIYVNVLWGTFLCLQLPNINRLFLSARLDNEIVRGSTGWAWVVTYRRWLALQLVGRLLEPFDKSNPKQHNTYGEFVK